MLQNNSGKQRKNSGGFAVISFAKLPGAQDFCQKRGAVAVNLLPEQRKTAKNSENAQHLIALSWQSRFRWPGL
jgi:hypothetical protein